MNFWTQFLRTTIRLLGCILLSACTLDSLDPLTTVPPVGTPPPLVTLPAEESVQEPDINDWTTIAPGVEQRVLSVDGSFTQLMALRFDPAQVRFRAHYRPQEPLSLRQWQSELPDALAIVNTNFFTVENTVLGLLVADGAVFGQPHTDRGGWFGVQNGVPFVRSNTLAPYQGEALEQAVQAFPMLVVDGGQAYTSTAPDRVTRRTVIGQDAEGRILVLITAQGGITLVDLSAFLANSDMGLVNAFNLDGGGSTMLSAGEGGVAFSLPSFDPVPAVLAIYPQ